MLLGVTYSPNVFLVSLEDDAPIRAKLADYGLVRLGGGNLRMGLDTRQWLAPEVMDSRGGFNSAVRCVELTR